MLFKSKKRTFCGEILFIARILACLFSLGLLVSALSLAVSAYGLLFFVLQFLFAVAVIAPFNGGKYKSWAAIVVLAAAILNLIVFGFVQKAVSPTDGQIFRSGLINPTVMGGMTDERDLVLTLARIMPFIGGVSFAEAKGLIPELINSYNEMESEQGNYSSLFFDSLIGVPSFVGSEILSFNSKDSIDSKSAVVFLHGTGGNISLVCWMISKASQSIGASTYCPSLNVLGNWGSDPGRKIVTELISSLHLKGVENIYLVGLSSGAVGVGQIAASLSKDLKAAALLFGGHPAIRQFSKPVLFIYGKEDERFPVALLNWVANVSAMTNAKVTIKVVEGGHFFALQHKSQFLELFQSWLLEESKPG